METVNVSTAGFTTGYYTDYHHTEQTGFDAATLASFKVDRFFIELSDDPTQANATMLGTATLTITDDGTVESNASMDGVSTNDLSSAHLETMTGTLWGIGDFTSTNDTGTVWDQVGEPRLLGIRFDGVSGVQEGSPIVGYLVPMINANGGAWYFFPTADQDLSTFNMPYPAGVTAPPGYTPSDITHAEYLPDQDSDATGTYVAYGDIYSGLPSQFTGAVCFTKGTLIHTINGQSLIEELELGDLIWTADQGYQPIRWIGVSTLSARDLNHREKLRPIRIPKGALGALIPEFDLTVSPQHRIFLQSKFAQPFCQTEEVLVPAKDLIGTNGIHRVQDGMPVTYYHIMFSDHQIIMSNGCLSESFFTGPEAIRALTPAARRELYDIFPELIIMTGMAHTPARPFLRGNRARKVIDSHNENGYFS